MIKNCNLLKILKVNRYKYSKDKNRLRKIVTADPHFLSVDRKAGQVIKILTGSDFEIREEEEKIDRTKKR